ncbi:putative phd-finger domain-containing protein [Erysiphe neolycopersici]|uniref:Putative phd-finger domain-containing protein n=1 Tax=Erysiphe neolycopersici TaxID=212602 RepID=A0A420I0Q6_9PEZI|nr:putative phd-finger domain-containing protein [Erysiphe neolycopersici]
MDSINNSDITMSYQQQNLGLKFVPIPKISSSNVLSPKIGTPKSNTERENCTGWTPYFAEEYSVFNSTPGRLTNCVTFAFNSPIQSQGISRREATSELDIPVKPLVESQSLLGSDILCQHLTSCDSNIMTQGIFSSDSVTQCVTPKPVKKYANKILTGQTATPPASASQTSRKLEFNFFNDKVHRDIQHIHSSPTAMRQSTKSLFFSETNLPGQESFKNNDVTTYSTDFSSSKDDIFFSSLHSKIDSQYNWSESILTPRSDAATFGFSHDNPILYSRTIESQTFNNNISDISDSFSNRVISDRLENYDEPSDCFLNASISGVNPGLLVSRKSSISMSSTSIETSISLSSAANTSTEPLIPYEHQRRESIRSQEERSRRQDFPHPPNSSRSMNNQRVFPHKYLANTRPLKKLRRNGEFNFKTSDLSNTKYLFSTQQQSLGNQDSFFGPSGAHRQTELRLIVDARGRARIETINTRGKKREAIICAQKSCCAKISRKRSQLDEKSSSPPILNRYFTLSQNFSPTEISKARISPEKKSSRVNSYQNNCITDDLSSSDMELSSMLNHRNLGDATLELWEVIKSRKRVLTSAKARQAIECCSEIL